MNVSPRLLLLFPAVKEPPESGGEIYNLKLARGLGGPWKTTVATFDDLPGFARDESAYAAAVRSFVAENGPFDAIVQDTYVYPFATAANRFLSAHAPLIGFGQGMYSQRFTRPWVRWSHRRQMRRAMAPYRGLIVVGEAMKAHARGLGMAGDRIAVVNPGYDLPSPPSRLPASQPLRLIVAGSYQPAKGQHLAIEGFAEVLARRPELVGAIRMDLYGNEGYAPEYVRELRAWVRRRGLSGSIELHGPLPQAKLWDEFRASQAFVFPALGEGMGMVTVEAMTFGCVPILADTPTARHLLGPEPAGLVVARQSREIAEAILRLIEDPARWEARRERAQARSSALVRGWDETVAEFSHQVRRLSGIEGV